jgi:hypothetical protein
MPWAIREYEVIGVGTWNDTKRGAYVGVYDTEEEALEELDKLINELKIEFESNPDIEIVYEDEWGIGFITKDTYDELVEQARQEAETEEEFDELFREYLSEGYDYYGYDLEEISEEKAERIAEGWKF